MAIRYGLIGAGMMGHEHIRNISLLDGAEISAIADPNDSMRRSAQAEAGGRATLFSDYRDLLSQASCDALVIGAPNFTHHAILKDALATNLPILCEKPLCTTTADCRDIVERARDRAAPVWVAMEYRYMPPIQRLIGEVRRGTPGPARMVSIREHRYPFLDKVGDWNRFNARTGGTLVEKCCHFWDLMRLILQSDPVRVYASAGTDVNHLGERYHGRTPDIIDNAFVVVDFASGARGMLDLCMFAEGSYWQEVISVTGDAGQIDARIPGPARFDPEGRERASEIEISLRDGKQVKRQEVEVDAAILSAGDHHGSTYFQHQRFLELVRAQTGTAEVDLVDGLWSVIVGEAAEESARTGRAIGVSI